MSQINRPEVIAFLNAIKENPDDDSLRLILADYLEERDDPRGTFLRCETEIASMDRFDDRIWDLKKHRDQLWTEHQNEWLGPLESKAIAPSVGDERISCRGLLTLTMKRDELLRKSTRDLAETETWAWVEEVRTGIGQKGVPKLSDSPLLSGVSSLLLTQSELRRAGAIALGKASFVSNLRRLSLRGNRIKDAGMNALLQSGKLGQLTSLDLHDCQLRCPSIETMAQTDLRLETLLLDNNYLAGTGADALIQAPWLETLHTLGLSCTSVGTRGIQAIANCERLSNLKSLDLSYARVEEEGCRLLTQASFTPNLIELDVSVHWFGEEHIRALNEGEWPSLSSLDLSHNPIEVNEIQALLECERLTRNLDILKLDCELLPGEVTTTLAEHPFLSQLRSLTIRAPHETSTFESLFQSPHVEQLQELCLPGSTWTGNYFPDFLSRTTMTSLRRLSMPEAILTEDWIEQLIHSKSLQNLREIEIPKGHLSPTTQEMLAERFDRNLSHS